MGKDSRVNSIHVYTVIIHYTQVEMLTNPFLLSTSSFGLLSLGYTKILQKQLSFCSLLAMKPEIWQWEPLAKSLNWQDYIFPRK